MPNEEFKQPFPGFEPAKPQKSILFTPPYEISWEDLVFYKDQDTTNIDKIIKDSKKFGLDSNNPTERKIFENLDTSAEEFISNHRKGQILREFPGEYLESSLKEIMEDAGKKDKSARKALKLLKDGRFSK